MTKKIVSLTALLAVDISVILISFVIAYFFRNDILPLLSNKFQSALLPLSKYLEYSYMIFIWIFIFSYEKLYTKRIPFLEEVRLLIKSNTVSFALIMAVIFITRKQIDISRTIVFLALVLSLFLLPLCRYFAKRAIISLGLWRKKLLIIGANAACRSLLESVKNNRTLGYETIGLLDDDPQKKGKVIDGVKVLGSISELETIASPYSPIDIIITLTGLTKENLDHLVKRCSKMAQSLKYVPKISDLTVTGIEIENLGQTLVLNVRNNLAKPWNIAIKYVFDICFSVILIIIFLPVFFVIAAAVRYDSKGPIFFKQERIGREGKKFHLLKFRSMFVDSHNRMNDYLKSHPEAKKEWEEFKKIKSNDPRVTRVGRFIRRFSLDELPQLLNIIQGKMSLVGPRPYLLEELKSEASFREIIGRVKPGLTGQWQISGRSDRSFSERIAFDEYYIHNWSLWMDIVILIKSLKVWLLGQGAY